MQDKARSKLQNKWPVRQLSFEPELYNQYAEAKVIAQPENTIMFDSRISVKMRGASALAP